ncbi:LOW QUALITY PROTEIN: Pentatricopeptide repeat [Dillenia turbinata]|uniref:Pentatricopeptide repeat n=1 Tax=Dillenia turbinata TaxID=194707 RepID=A0AAN8UZG1_9MAGN
MWSETKPDNFTFPCILHVCSESCDFRCPRLVHGGWLCVVLGLNLFIAAHLCLRIQNLVLLMRQERFLMVLEPDLALWNSKISGYGSFGLWDRGWDMFNMMRRFGQCPAEFSIFGLISGLADSLLVGVGQAMHSFCIKCGFHYNVHTCSALVSIYLKPDLVTWSALITGFSKSGEYRKADHVLVASVVAASAQLAITGLGKELHGYVFQLSFQSDIMVSSKLIDMYSKCGLIGLGIGGVRHHARKEYSALQFPYISRTQKKKKKKKKDSLILDFGLHGLASEASRTIDKLLDEGLKPDESTFSALLSACCHAGLAMEGRDLLRRMAIIEAKTEHFVHMVKLLGMTGELEEAYDLVLSLPKPVDSGVWGALLSCSDIHWNTELGKIVAKQLIETKPEKSAYWVMLSNINAGESRWGEVNKLRDSISGGGLKKMPGLSWIGDGGI